MNLLHEIGNNIKYALEGSTYNILTVSKVGKHDFPGILQFIVASEQSLTQNLLHIIELTTCISHLPEDSLYVIKANISA